MTLSPEQFAFYLHVDDGVVFGDGCRGDTVNKLMHAAADFLEQEGFNVSDRQLDPELEKIVGYTVVRKPARLELPLKRAFLLRAALRWFVAQAHVNKATLRSIVGVWIWGALLRRELLVIPHAIFRFMNYFDGDRALWWQSARREASVMAEVVPMMFVHFGGAGCAGAICHGRPRRGWSWRLRRVWRGGC
jgi:hypothetical protein